MMYSLLSTVDGIVPGATGDSDLGANDADSGSDGAPSSRDTVGTNSAAVVVEVPRNVAAEEGGLTLVLVVPLALPFVLTGGHSRALRCSSFTASVLFEVTLVARDGGPDDVGWRFCCCSKRPMRFA